MRLSILTVFFFLTLLVLVLFLFLPQDEKVTGNFYLQQQQLVVAARCPQNQKWTDTVVSQALKITRQRLTAVKDARSLNNHDLCTMPAKKLARAFYRLDTPKSDQPDEWAKYRKMQQMSENGEVKADGLSRAILQRLEMIKRDSPSRTVRRAGITKDHWESIGPGNIGGRIRSILIHPTQPKRMWVGSVSGGIWHSENGGSSWEAVDDFMGNLSVSSMVMDPDNSDIMYAGTGEGFFNHGASKGAGIFKSVDGGKKWVQLAATKPNTKKEWEYVNRIAIHPFQGNILLAATNNGLFRSVDFGEHWDKVISEYRIDDVKFDPNSSSYAVASGRVYNKSLRAWDTYIFYSSTTGRKWNIGHTFEATKRIELAYAKNRLDYLYASVNNINNYSKCDDDNDKKCYGEIYKSSDNGQTWQFLAKSKHLGNQGWYDNTIWVDPTDHTHLIVGGITLFRSTDAGIHWNKMTNWENGRIIHPDQHAIISHPNYNATDNKTIYFANDGGIYKSNDIDKEGWISLNNNLAITQFYSGAGHKGKNGRIIGGTQDNGTLIYTGDKNKWEWFAGGDGSATAINPNDGNYIYGAYQWLELYRSTNGGKTQKPICKGISEVERRDDNNGNIICGTEDSVSATNFISHFILDPNNSDCLLAGAASLWRSCNINATSPQWDNIKSPINDNYWGYINTLAIAKGNSNIIWIGHNNGSLYRSHNGKVNNPIWQRMGESELPKRQALNILIDKDNSDRVYVGFGGYENNNLYVTTDAGNSWSNIASGLPESPVHTIERHPTKANWLYVGTEVGVFTSENGGETWTAVNDGPANVPVFQLFWLDSKTLIAATHGRGMFKTVITEQTDSVVSLAPVPISPNAIVSDTTPYYQWKPVNSTGQYEIKVQKSNGGNVFKQKVSLDDIYCNDTEYCGVSLENLLDAGDYQWQVRAYQGAKAGVWSELLDFTLDPSMKPDTVITLSPEGDIYTKNPIYKWKRAEKATDYRLWVTDSTLEGDYDHSVIHQWYSAEDLGCDNNDTCSITPAIELSLDAHRWWVQAWNTTGTGNWSKGKNINIISGTPLEIPVLTSPKNIISDTTPYYRWEALDNLDHYEIRVKKGSKIVLETIISDEKLYCGGTDYCGFVSEKELDAGDYQWQLRIHQGSQQGEWSEALNFHLDPSKKPDKVTLISPSGNISTNKPSYRWKAANKATNYYLSVSNIALIGSNQSENIISKWYTAEELGCNNGNQQCVITPDINLSWDKHRWWVLSWNKTGYGEWSIGKDFQVIKTSLSTPTLTHPKSIISDVTPYYQWDAVDNATQYEIRVKKAGAIIFQQFVPEDKLYCSDDGYCGFTVDTELVGGKYLWQIRAHSATSKSSWSQVMEFTLDASLKPDTAVLISPKGNISSQRPSFYWNPAINTDQYFLVISNASSEALSGAYDEEILKKWYTKEELGCSNGLKQCAIKPDLEIPKGLHRWWIRTWNSTGYGDWSKSIDFKVE